jgi:hypothetical protein
VVRRFLRSRHAFELARGVVGLKVRGRQAFVTVLATAWDSVETDGRALIDAVRHVAGFKADVRALCQPVEAVASLDFATVGGAR